jgi:hypothetical protein
MTESPPPAPSDAERLRKVLEAEVYVIQTHQRRGADDTTEAHVYHICAAIVEEFGLTANKLHDPDQRWAEYTGKQIACAILDVAASK